MLRNCNFQFQLAGWHKCRYKHRENTNCLRTTNSLRNLGLMSGISLILFVSRPYKGKYFSFVSKYFIREIMTQSRSLTVTAAKRSRDFQLNYTVMFHQLKNGLLTEPGVFV